MNGDFEKIKKIKQKYQSRWLAIPGVVAVGVGLTKNQKPGIIISVSKKFIEESHLIPDEIEGIPIEIVKTGEIKAL